MRATLLLLAAVALLLGACGGGALDPVGPGARAIERMWWVMLAGGVVVWCLVAALTAAAALRRPAAAGGRERGEGDGSWWARRGGQHLVIAGGIVLPALVVLPLAAYVLVVSDRLSHQPQEGDLAVEVVGHQFWWEMRYPGTAAITANELHVPVGRTVALTMRSADVIHSFWVPRVHGKIDLIPGQETNLRFQVDRPGTYRGACAEFCGIQHAGMKLRLVAQPGGEFDQWLARQASEAAFPSESERRRGLQTFQVVGCGACHRVRGTEAKGSTGPDLTHLASRATIGAGVLPNTRGHLAGWILDATAQKPGSLMPPQPVPPEELNDLLAYLQGLE